MNSKLIFGIPATIIALGIVYNFFTTTKESFENLRGDWVAEAGGPHEGCVRIVQPGAGIKVWGFFSAAAAEAEKPDFTGAVHGSVLNIHFQTGDGKGSAALNVAKGGRALSGTWMVSGNDSTSAQGNWDLSRQSKKCM
ncbi:MAG: hypothetical protein ACE5GZ_12415 [Gammaproteobacteria bacterium]